MKDGRGRLTSNALVSYVRTKNPENLHLLWAPLKQQINHGKDPESFLKNPRNQVGIEVCQIIMGQAKKATSDKMAVYKAALELGCQTDSVGIWRKFLLALSSPKRAIKKFQKNKANLPACKKIEIVSLSNTTTVIRLHWLEDIQLSSDFCLFAKGTFQAVPAMFYLPPARLWERVCFFEGGPYCEYEMWWDGKSSRKSRHLGTSLNNEPLQWSQKQETKDKERPNTQNKGRNSMKRDGKPQPQRPITKKQQGAIQHPGKIARQMDELFTRIQATASLMLTNINADHPYFRHLTAIEGMAQKGANLKKQLVLSPNPDKAKHEASQRKTSTKMRWPTDILKGAECVLLADDEDMILNIGQQMLKAIGYRVLTAKTGLEAIEIYKKNKNSIALVILGLMMPDQDSCMKVYKTIRELNPGVGILISSGYTIDRDARQILEHGRNGFIQRPFSIKQLSEKMRAILDN
ncbi:MAG: response regulator [Deltaproteobacteria bacterium]|nr:response regulator [Deltaproteobacteria bacterium]